MNLVLYLFTKNHLNCLFSDNKIHFWSNCNWVGPVRVRDPSEVCAHRPTACSSIGICQRAQELAVQKWHSVLFTDKRFTLSTRDRLERVWRHCSEHMSFATTSSRMSGLAVSQWWSVLENSTYCDPLVHPAGAVGTWFCLMEDNPQSYVARERR